MNYSVHKNIHISDQKPSLLSQSTSHGEHESPFCDIRSNCQKQKGRLFTKKKKKKKNLERLHTSSLIYEAEWGIMGTGTKSGAWNQIFFYVLLIFKQNFVKWFFENPKQ